MVASNDEEKYTWIGFYSEFADKLLMFKGDRNELISKLVRVYQVIGMKLPKLESTFIPSDIDPFTVFGLFNKGISDANRRRIVASLAEEFGIAADQPTDFEGIPVLNNLNATFYRFDGDEHRKSDDIDRLWDVFEACIAYADLPNVQTRANFIASYNNVFERYGVGWRLTMGLYWARPYAFINLDSRNRWFLENQEAVGSEMASIFKEIKSMPDASTYLSLVNDTLAAMQSGSFEYDTFPKLSLEAWKVSEKVNEQNREKAKTAQSNALGDADLEITHYWLYTPGESAEKWDEFYSKGVMAIGWSELGDLSSYVTKSAAQQILVESYGGVSQKNSAYIVWQFVHDVKPGDIIFVKRGRTEILGRGVVESGYAYEPEQEDYPNVHKVRWTDKGSWKSDEVFAIKTLIDITDYPELIDKIELFFIRQEGEEPEIMPQEYPAYSDKDFLDEVFMDDEDYRALVSVLEAKKNIILQGAPGVGKTFLAKRLAYSIIGEKNPDRVMMVQFHQSYSYEDFIEGFRPTATGFELTKGAFYTFCKVAAFNPEDKHFFIIDEINRGNLSKIFGELFMLIEGDKRGSKNKLQLLYSHELFYVPDNVYIIGMMNTADRSLAMLDYALRRRFAFFDIAPGFESERFKKYQEELRSERFDSLVSCIMRLNEAIAFDDTLGEGFQIGHSYLCNISESDINNGKLNSIVDYEIVPMLKEYWFDDMDKVRRWNQELKRSIK